MKTINEVLGSSKIHEGWGSLLELATREVFSLMLGVTLSTREGHEEEQVEFTAMVGLAGQICGMVSIRCGKRAVALMAERMLGSSDDPPNGQTQDALGEICNMIAGNFKNKISGSESVMLSVPTVITGESYSVYSLAESAYLETRMLFEGFPILISLELHS